MPDETANTTTTTTDSPRWQVSRRAWLGSVAAGTVVGAVGGNRLTALGIGSDAEADAAEVPSVVDFHGERQAGVETPQQAHALFTTFDLTGNDPAKLLTMLDDWTTVAAALSVGDPVPRNKRFPPTFNPTTDLAAGLDPSRLTITFGLGPSLFDKIPKLAKRRPKHLVPLPEFRGDQLNPLWCDGDLLLQICADDKQVVSHAFRIMRARVPGLATLRWNHYGFLSTPAGGGTPRTMLGHRDGTANPRPGTPAFDDAVWTRKDDAEPDWFTGGTYLAFRKIRIKMADWDLTPLKEQDRTIGRRRRDGAPLTGRREHDEPDLAAKDEDGELVIAPDAHVRMVRDIPMLRRGYSYDNGLQRSLGPTVHKHADGHTHVHPPGVPEHNMSNHEAFDAGLLFAAYVRDPAQFTRAQRKMTEGDALSTFIEHTGSALFAIPPGMRPGQPIADGLV